MTKFYGMEPGEPQETSEAVRQVRPEAFWSFGENQEFQYIMLG
jgi:hypothetical protein